MDNEEIRILEGYYNKVGIRYTYVYFKNLIITFISNFPKDTCKCDVSRIVNGIPIFMHECKDFNEAEPIINKELILQLIN